MKDENNNASDASKDSDTNVKLVKWLKDHTDPYKNPWSTNDWKQSDNILSLDNNDNKKIVIDPTANRENDDDCKLVLGVRNEAGELDGNVNLQWSNGDMFKGMYKSGLRHGWGVVTSPDHDILALTGDWHQGWLEDKVRLVTKTTTVFEGWCHQSCFHGPIRKIEMKKFRMFKQQVTWIGLYQMGLPYGQCWQWSEGGGWLTGVVDIEGEFTGDDIAFVYPDLKTALVGQFTKGLAISVFPGTLSHVDIPKDGVACPRFQTRAVSPVSYSPSTRSSVGPSPLVRDPYEMTLCEVRGSNVPGGGEGLFAVRNINKGEVVAFYNGIRLPYVPGERENWETSGYKIFVNADHSSGERIDLPGELIHMDHYCATLGHKMNHNFDYNSTEWFFNHPRHGVIPCALADRNISQDEELFLHYGYDPNNCPDWYKSAVQQYLSQHSDLDLWQVVDPNRLEKKQAQWKEDIEIN